MPSKVLLDTNVIIAAALKFYVSTAKLDVKHDFYDQSSRLFELFRKNLDKRIGIVTSTVEEESFGVLLKALNSTIDKRVASPEELRKDYEAMTVVADLCESNMRKLLSLLLREPIPETSIQHNLRLVDDMCLYLDQMVQNYNDPTWIEIAAWKHWSPTPFNPKWSSELKREGLDVYMEQLHREKRQLDRYANGGPSPIDKRILAEAIYLTNYYAQNLKGGAKFFIASCDSKFFSVYRTRGGIESRFVTDEIYKRFKIWCDWPYALVPILDEIITKEQT